MREHASGPGHRWRAPIRPRAGRSLCGSALPCGKGSRQVGQPQRTFTTIPPPPPLVGHLRSPYPRRSALDVGGGDAGGKAQPISAPLCHLVRRQRRLTDAECDEVARLRRSLPCSACYRYLAVQGSMLRSMPWRMRPRAC